LVSLSSAVTRVRVRVRVMFRAVTRL